MKKKEPNVPQICKICNKELISLVALSNHLRGHSMTNIEYYDRYLKKDKNEGICSLDVCGNTTRFVGLGTGYKKFCCIECANSSEIHNTPEYFKKLSISLKKAWDSGKLQGNKGMKGKWSSWFKGKTKQDCPSLARKSEKLKGKAPWNKGVTGKNNPLFGVLRPKEVCEKISISKKGKTFTEEHKKKLKDKGVYRNCGKGGIKSQEFFKQLEDLLKEFTIDFTIVYGICDYVTRKVIQKEKPVNVFSTKSEYKTRFLDCYIKYNEREINIEFDEPYHFKFKKINKKDIEREQDIFEIMPNLEMYRVKQVDFDNNPNKVLYEIIDIIINNNKNTYYSCFTHSFYEENK